MLAATTGLRQGVIMALHPGDIGEVVIHFQHSWIDTDGLKTPKNGEERRVPVLPEISRKLFELVAMNPYGPDGWIF